MDCVLLRSSQIRFSLPTISRYPMGLSCPRLSRNHMFFNAITCTLFSVILLLLNSLFEKFSHVSLVNFPSPIVSLKTWLTCPFFLNTQLRAAWKVHNCLMSLAHIFFFLLHKNQYFCLLLRSLRR